VGSSNCPAGLESAIFLPQRKMKKAAFPLVVPAKAGTHSHKGGGWKKVAVTASLHHR
jgi:hypothetical protein